MTKEFAPGLALDTGEFIPASDLNAQTAAPPVPTSATWGNWREPTTVAQRLGDVLQLLCGGKRPPNDVVLAWLDVELGDIGLQHFCAQHGPAWAQGIGLIDLAMVAVAQPTDGVDHEQVEIEPQVELAYAPPRPVTPYTCPKCRALWLHWPSEQTGFGKDALNCRSADHCHYCEKGGVEQLQRLERVPATLAAPQPSPAAQGDALDTMRLDWLDADESRCVFHLGKSWYTRPSYGLPYRKRASLREAIDASRAAQEHKA